MQANISCRRLKKKNLRKHTEETKPQKREPGPFFRTNRIQVKPRRAQKNKEKLFKVGRDTGTQEGGGRNKKKILQMKEELTEWNLGRRRRK